MKITNVEYLPVHDGRTAFFVVVHTDEGLYGVGECGLPRAHSKVNATAGMVQDFASILVGEDPFRIEDHWQRMSRGFFFPHDRVAGSALAAIDIALWDILGKATNLPIYQLLGGRVRDKVVCYPHLGGGSAEQLAENALAAREEGWKFARFSPPTGREHFDPAAAIRGSVAQFEQLRKALGDTMELCSDVHTRLDPSEAIQLCRAVEQYRPFFIEDPIRSENPQSFRYLRQHVHVPLAAGEQFASKWEFRQFIEEDLIDYARVDVCICGGITESKKIANWAETHYIKLAAHNPLGPVSSAACLQLSLAVSNLGVMEQPQRPGRFMNNAVPVQVEWQDGYLLPPTRPGLGIELDLEAARKLRYEPGDAESTGRHPGLRRIDGSFTNW